MAKAVSSPRIGLIRRLRLTPCSQHQSIVITSAVRTALSWAALRDADQIQLTMTGASYDIPPCIFDALPALEDNLALLVLFYRKFVSILSHKALLLLALDNSVSFVCAKPYYEQSIYRVAKAHPIPERGNSSQQHRLLRAILSIAFLLFSSYCQLGHCT